MTDLKLFFNTSHDIFCIMNRDGYYKKVNPSFLNLSGYEEEELFSRPFTYYLHPDDLEATKKEYEEVARGKPNNTIENRFKKKDGTYCWLSWSSIVLGEGGMFYTVAQDVTQRKNLQEALQKEEESSQRKVTVAIVETQEKERAEISRELHDNVNQILTTVKLYSELCLEGVVECTDSIPKSIELLQQAIDEIRNLSKRLSDTNLEHNNLVNSIEELLASITQANTIKVDLQASTVNQLQVSQHTHLTVYRIIQEHLTNILKHAAARNVTVTLHVAENALHLQVTDDGVGFDTSRKSEGIGIKNMRTRAEIMKGTLRIHSNPGQGCRLVVSLPLDRP